MFEKWTGGDTTKYILIHHTDLTSVALLGEWELVSEVSRPHTKGVKTFRNSCGRFDSEEGLRRAMKMLEGMK